MVPQSKGGQKLKKKPIEHNKGRFLSTQKVLFMLFFCYYSSTMICRALDGSTIAFQIVLDE
jgi:hypothetical protein